MRRRIVKKCRGRNTDGKKEVAIRVNKAFRTSGGEQRYTLAVRFTNESYKKASNTEYVTIEIDDELNRMYFLTAGNPEDGFKLTKSGGDSANRSVSFSIEDKNEWEGFCGDYDLLFDINERIYYIELKRQ